MRPRQAETIAACHIAPMIAGAAPAPMLAAARAKCLRRIELPVRGALANLRTCPRARFLGRSWACAAAGVQPATAARACRVREGSNACFALPLSVPVSLAFSRVLLVHFWGFPH